MHTGSYTQEVSCIHKNGTNTDVILCKRSRFSATRSGHKKINLQQKCTKNVQHYTTHHKHNKSKMANQ